MTRSERRSRIAGSALSILAIAAVGGWALAHATAAVTAGVALAAIAGVVIFAAGLTSPFAPMRDRAIATALLLVGIAAVLGTSGQAVMARTGTLAISGATLFCAAEIAARSLDRTRRLERRGGVDVWSPTWVLGVALGSSAFSYGAIAVREPLSGGGPAALAAGTVAATLVGLLTVLLLWARARNDSQG